MTVRPKIGLLGGSFNPIHIAHIELALSALKQLPLEHVELLPAGQPWQKDTLSVSREHRLAMLKIAAEDNPKILFNTMEIERDGPTYTVDTVRQLDKNIDYFWLMGTDQLQNFTTWNGWQEIMQTLTLVIAKRPDYSSEIPQAMLDAQVPGKEIIQIFFDEMDISSTEVRQRLANNEDVSDYVHPEVIQYINEHHLYKN
ncbi:Probable nicotinate-nucleotide adenylyltransferase [Oligella ureolytica]|nr:Probable nicotinate-nucleotide adenylyltransferase [Oligella ureolytica]SUA58719.1 Probable nicotinate-nucleotide adenylyltransferase [Oligella ureolytica]